MSPTVSERVAGSFRDPSGFVFKRGERIYRALNEQCHDLLAELSSDGLLERLVEDGLLIGTRFVDGDLRDSLREEHSGFEHFLEHDVVDPVTYPYEWTYSMLADAALLTLRIQMTLLEAGLSLKDASAYNIQFVRGRPVFIDVASIERPARLDIWFAMAQFGQMFTFPLMLQRYHGFDLASYFLGRINGRSFEEVVRTLGRVQRWRPRALLDVTLPLLLNRRAQRSSTDRRHLLSRPCKSSSALRLNLQRLAKKIRKLAKGYKPKSHWTAYVFAGSCSQSAQEVKRGIVQQYLNAAAPRRVLDLGCNTGDYSFLAAQTGADVVAADADHDAVDLLYRRLRDDSADISPAVLDICNPTPAIGFRNRERVSFLERVQADCVLALALLHHLQIACNLRLPLIRDLFYDLTDAYVILEHVPPDDPMTRRLQQFRREVDEPLALEYCRGVFAERFSILREQVLPGGLRRLLLMRKT